MLSDKFISLVEKRADRLKKRWVEMIQTHPATASYHTLDDEPLENSILQVYRNLGDYMDQPYDDDYLGNFFMNIGRARREQNVPLHELIFAIHLVRRNVMEFIMDEGVFNSTLDYHQVTEFWRRVMNFFDKNIYFVVIGFNEQEKSAAAESDTDIFSKYINSFSLGVFPEVDKKTTPE